MHEDIAKQVRSDWILERFWQYPNHREFLGLVHRKNDNRGFQSVFGFMCRDRATAEH